jgi:hypothetical protein
VRDCTHGCACADDQSVEIRGQWLLMSNEAGGPVSIRPRIKALSAVDMPSQGRCLEYVMTSEDSERGAGSTTEPMPALVARLQKQVAEARATGSPDLVLATANAAADEIERRIGVELTPASISSLTGPTRAALLAVKRMTYNAAADCWPGWLTTDQRPNHQQLLKALATARRSALLVQTLSLGPVQEGTANWLIGAFELVLGQFDQAVDLFTAAHERYVAANAPGLALLTEGYLAITYKVGRRPMLVTTKTLDQVIAAISAGNFEDGDEWVAQLRAAIKLFE